MIVKLDLLPNDKEVSLEIEIEGVSHINKMESDDVTLDFYNEDGCKYAMRQLTEEGIPFNYSFGLVHICKASFINIYAYDDKFKD